MDFSTEKLSSQGSELLSLMVLFLVVHEIIHHPEFQWEGSRLAHTEKPGKDEIEEREAKDPFSRTSSHHDLFLTLQSHKM